MEDKKYDCKVSTHNMRKYTFRDKRNNTLYIFLHYVS